MFTKQHFEEIAEALSGIKDRVDRHEVAVKLAEMFQASNPRFNLGRFLSACDLFQDNIS